MKFIISIITGILVFILGFWLDNQFINWCVLHLSNPHGDLALLVKIGLWIVTFSTTFAISAWVGILVGALIYDLIRYK